MLSWCTKRKSSMERSRSADTDGRVLGGGFRSAAFLDRSFTLIPTGIPAHATGARRARVGQAADRSNVALGVAAVVISDALLDPVFLMTPVGATASLHSRFP